MTTQADPLREACYPEREIFAYGRYINCQIMNWREGSPPQYLVCNPLDANHRETFLATQGMGTWMRVDESGLIRLIAALAQSPAPQGEARDPRVERMAKHCCVPEIDEPFFVLLGRDPQAPGLVEKWAQDRAQVEPGDKAVSAYATAKFMRMWKDAHPERGLSMEAFAKIATPQGDFEPHHGWLFFNEDTGTEWSQNHPVRSGECPGAKTVKPATLQNLHAELMEAWRGWAEARELGPAPQGEGMREALECAQHVLRTMEILALRDLASPEEVAAATHEAERDGYAYFIGNALQKIHIALSTTPIPSDRAGREEEIAEQRDGTFETAWDEWLNHDAYTQLHDADKKPAFKAGYRAALRQSASAGIERAAEGATEAKNSAARWQIGLERGDWKPTRAHIEAARKSFNKISELLRPLSSSASRE